MWRLELLHAPMSIPTSTMTPPLSNVEHNGEDLQRAVCNLKKGCRSHNNGMHGATGGDVMRHVV